MQKRISVLVGVIIIVALLLAACSPSANSTQPSGGGATQAPGSTNEPSGSATTAGTTANVEMKNIQYVPAELTVKAGTTVVWTNKDSVAHTVDSGTRDNPTSLFKSGNVEPGKSFSYTFSTPGTYPYFCEPHQSMNGTITVTQ
ncbi:MAG: cupredoxin domain-containing protein [Anaerolineae bacterium]